MRSGSNWAPRFAIYGDLGNINAQSLPRLQKEAMTGMYDAILHVGKLLLKVSALHVCHSACTCLCL